ALREEIEGHERRRRLRRELRHPRGRRVQAQLQHLEVEPALARDHDLSVDYAARGKAGLKGGLELGEVAIEGLQVAALEVEAVAVAEHDGTEPVPLRLEEPAIALGQLRRELRQHRLDRRLDRESHSHGPQWGRGRRAAIRPSAAAQPASKGRPLSSMSITSGAWSEGTGLPLRASRSISAHTVRCTRGTVTSRWSMRMPKFLWKFPAR